MKRFLRRTLCLFFIVLIMPLFSLSASAEDDGAVLHSLDFGITLMEDGCAYITETREIVFSGDQAFSRYTVNHFFTGPRTFRDWEVSIDGISLQQLDEPDNEYRPENTFAVEDGDGENTVIIYFRQQGSGTRLIRISYFVDNAVKLYSDVGEFFWNLTGEKGISDIGMLTASVTVPEGVPEEEFRIWAHGPLNGTFEKQADDTAYLQVDDVSRGTIVDIRITLPADFFCGGWEQEGEALPDILAKEQELADSANARREEAERNKAELEAYWIERHAWEEAHPVLYSIEHFCQSICDTVWGYLTEHGAAVALLLLFVIPLLVTICSGKIANLIRRINKKRFKLHPAQSPRYYRDLPDHRPAPVVDRLVHFYDEKPSISRQISAALLELNLKKLIRIRTVHDNTELLLDQQLGEELFPSVMPEQEHIQDYQEILWHFLMSAAEGSDRISIKEFKNYIRGHRDAAIAFRRSFEGAVRKDYAEWVQSEDVKGHLPKNNKLLLRVCAAAGVLAMLICMFSTLYDGIRFGFALLAGAAVFLVLVILLFGFGFLIDVVLDMGVCHLLEQKSEDDLAMWQAFGRFLDDFTTFSEKELPEFSVWRSYMVYAVAMGKGQKVAKALAVKYPEAVSAGSDPFYDDMSALLRDTDLYDAMDAFGREVSEIREPVSSGSYSDGDGGGGGFSDSDGGSDSGSGGDSID